jgi:hypothetical protein
MVASDPRIVTALLDKGASTTQRRADGRTALEYAQSMAQRSGSDAGVRLLKERRCEVCHATAAAAGLDELKKCGGCGGVYYCGREHQKEHWNATHKDDCDGSRAQRRAAARVEEVG